MNHCLDHGGDNNERSRRRRTMNNIITFTFVVSETEQPELQLPVDVLQAREEEMVRTAEKLGVARDKWHGSFLYQLYRRNTSATAHTLDCDGKSWLTQDNDDGSTTSCLHWLEQYYQTGLLQIPSTAHGYSVLAALEYFSILYAPDQCHFADYNVYERVQLWARYLSNRDALTASVLQQTSATMLKLQNNGGGGATKKTDPPPPTAVYFGVAPTHQEAMDLGTQRISALGGADHASTAHQLFAPRHDDQDATVEELREDFRQHVTCEVNNNLNNSNSTNPTNCRAVFTIKPITLHPPFKVVNRAVLGIIIISRRRSSPPDHNHHHTKYPPGLRKKKQKLVFLLPEELDVPIGRYNNNNNNRGGNHFNNNNNNGLLTMRRTATADENTVTSGLTGPFYTDTTGHVKDIFEHEEAKRHEWVQTALMNRGITERMERLLHPEEHYHTTKSTSSNPWDWFTGLGVCEMSRTVVERMGSYMHHHSDKNSLVTRDNVAVVVVTKKNNNNKAAINNNNNNNTTNVTPSSSSSQEEDDGPPVNPCTPSRMKDRFKELVMSELAHRQQNNIIIDNNTTNNCDESKESPRGVADFHHHPEPTTMQQEREQQPTKNLFAIADPTIKPSPPPDEAVETTTMTTVPLGSSNNGNNNIRKKGLLRMFRRRKEVAY
jgi:hypothetical protein